MLKTPLFLAFLFSLFIYFHHFGVTFWLLQVVIGLYVVYRLLALDKKQLFWFGFFAAIFWFYWVAFSFRYYEDSLWAALPSLLILSAAIGFLFFLAGFFKNPFLRAFYFLVFDCLGPFGFDWMKIELMFIDTPIGVDKFSFFFVLMAMAALHLEGKLKYVLVPLLIFALHGDYAKPESPDINIYLANTDVDQATKWSDENTGVLEEQSLEIVERAVSEGYDLVVLPESAFPYYINEQNDLIKRLEMLSQKTTIVAGALYLENDLIYNAAYIFQNGSYEVAKKVVLVPFGESVPLPEPLDQWVNDLFFGGASDFIKASEPTDFEVKGHRFRVAICYEATDSKIYEGAPPPYIVAMSNNAWFVPSVEPTLQRLLMRYYANAHHKLIFHSVNGSPSYIE